MKKFNIIATVLALFAPTMLWANSSYYYAYAKAICGEGCGKVYAGTEKTANPDYTASESTSASQGGKDKNSKQYTFYVYAQNKYGYKFKTWEVTTVDDNQSSNKGTATISNETIEKGALVTVTTGSKSFGDDGGTQNTTANVTATYEKCTDSDDHWTLTMGNNPGIGSYTISGPVDFPSIAPGNSARVWFNDAVSFSATPIEGYDFDRWCRQDANGTSYFTEATLENQMFTSDTTISAEFKQQVVCNATCLASEGGTYKIGDKTVSGANEVVKNFAEVSVTMSNPVANDEYEFYGWFKLHENGVTEYLSYYPSASITVTAREDVTIGAEFRKKADIKLTLEAPADGSLTYSIDNGSPVILEGEDAEIHGFGSISVSLGATSAYGNRSPKWYVKDELGVKSYFSITSTVARTVTASETIGVDFIAQNVVFANAIETVKDGGTVTLDSDSEIAYGTTMTIPDGVTVDLGGHTLYVDGVLVNNGAIQNGTISKCTKLIRQTGKGLEPIVADNISYWDTRIEDHTATAPDSSASHITIINGYGTVIHGVLDVDSPKAIVCTIDTAAGASVNTITGYVDDYEKLGGGVGGAIYAAGRTGDKTGKMVVQLTPSVSLSINNDFPDDGKGWQATKNSKPNGKLGQGFRLDSAHNSITVTYEFTNASTTYFINAKSAKRTDGYLLGATENFINCAEVSQRINNNSDYAVKFNLYDCANPSVTFSLNTKLSAERGVNFRSGGPYEPKPSSDTNFSNYHIYGGHYTTKPADGLNTKSGTHSFYQHADGYWYLEPKQEPYVAEIGGDKKYYLEKAFAAATAQEGLNSTITLLKDCTLENPVVIPKKVSVRVELAGCKITAANGFVINRGNLEIGDKYGNLSTSGCEVEEGNVFVNEAGGRIDVAYGKYSGGILLKSGSEFTTHHGRFEGAIAFGEGVSDKSAVANLRGGIFTADVTEYLTDGYTQMNGYVGALPHASIGDDNVSGYEKAYKVQAMGNEDLGLYTNANFVRDGSYTAKEWFRRAELYSSVAPYLGNTIDCVVMFDRDVPADSITAYGETIIGFSRKLDQAVAAGAQYRAISPKIASSKYYQISYSRFIEDEDVNSIVCALKSESDENIGTTCTFNLDLCTGANKYDVSKLKSVCTIGSRRFVFGAGDNAAMLQTESGAVPEENFYATLAAAVESDATTGKTIKLCNDCAETVTVGKACTIDTNGFAFTGVISAEDGYSVAESNGVYVISVPDPADVLVQHVNVANVVADVVTEEWLEANEISADATLEEKKAAVEAVLKEEDKNKLPKWQNLVIGQKSDKKVAVTAVNGGTATTVDVAVTFEAPKDENGQAVETGYTVKYAFDKVDGATGEVVENGAGEAQAEPRLDIESVTAEEGPSYFKMRAVLEASDESGVTAEVPVEKTIGVMKVESDAQYTILAVPWTSLGEGAVKASELVHAASLQNGDELIVYSDDGASFNKWTVKNGAWAASEEVELSDDGEVVENETPEPGSVGLARGKGVWLKRSKPAESPIYLIGQPSEEAVETPLAAAGEKNESWNLVASPSLEPVDVAVILDANKADADRVIVPRGENAAPKNFHWNAKKSKWGYDSTEIVYGKDGVTPLGVRAVFRTDDTSLPAGTGFWYLNSSKESKNIKW